MNDSPFRIIQRGYDSSGRPLKNTAMKWAAFDRINARMGGKLVIIQGAFMGSGGADASAGTHAFAGCNDVRRWNLTADEARRTIDIADSVGDIWYERYAPTFDPHFHNILPTDQPLHPDAAAQVAAFRRGENALASRGPDPHAPRPNPFPVFLFEEDDMFEDEDRRTLNQILSRLTTFAGAEKGRDQAEAEREKKRHQAVLQMMGRQVDQLGLALNMIKDDDSVNVVELRKLLRENRRQLLVQLKDDPGTDGTPDNPSDEAVDLANQQV